MSHVLSDRIRLPHIRFIFLLRSPLGDGVLPAYADDFLVQVSKG